MPIMTRSANDLEDVLAYGNALEKCGGALVSVTVEGAHKYPTALEPHNTYRIWGICPETLFDQVDQYYTAERFPDEEE